MKQLEENNFENAFQKAFEEALLAPPEQVWINVENTMPNFGSKAILPEPNAISGATKYYLGVSILFVAGICFYFMNNSTTKKSTTKPIVSHEKNIYKNNIKPEIKQNNTAKTMVYNPNFIANKKIKTNKPNLKDNQIQEIFIEPVVTTLENTDNLLPEKIEIKLLEIKPKTFKNTRIEFVTPNLILEENIQTPYFEFTSKPIDGNSKNNFWKNFKVKGGIRIGN